jgi:hypothetical protein
MEQLKNALRRAALSSETVDTLITEFEGQVFEPGDDLSRWFDCRDREYRRLRGQLSMREFRKTLALLLPDDSFHQPKIVAMSRAPASLKEVAEDCDSGQMATVKKELLAGAATLAKAAKKCGIRGQVWWIKPEEKKIKGKKSREVSVAEEGSGDPEVALLSKQLSQLVTIVEGMKLQQVAAVAAGAACA